MALDGINLVVSTVWRQESYLEATLDDLSLEYIFSIAQPLCIVVGSPVTTHLGCYRTHPGVSVAEMGPSTWSWIKDGPIFHRATWNYYRCLTHPTAGLRGTLALEDDIRFARGWLSRFEATLSVLEERHGSDFLLSLYVPSILTPKRSRCSRLYLDYLQNHFFGAQGIYYPAKVRHGFVKYLKAHGVVACENHYDFLLRDYLIQSDVPLFATNPCLIQHVGKESAIQNFWHDSANFVEDVTAGSTGLPVECDL